MPGISDKHGSSSLALFFRSEYALWLWLGSWLVVAAVIRLTVIFILPPTLDEIMLAQETLEFSWSSLPVQFISFGWGDNIFLSVIARPLIDWFGLTASLALRFVVLAANITFITALFYLAKRLFGRLTAALAVMFAALWPWSILAGSVGFNAFAFPGLMSLALLALVVYIDRPRVILLFAVAGSLAVSLYTYNLSLVWVASFLLLTLAVYGRKMWQRPAIGPLAAFSLIAAPITVFFTDQVFGWWPWSGFAWFTFPLLRSNRFFHISIISIYHGWSLLGHYVLNYFLHFIYLFLSYTVHDGVGFYFINVFFDRRFLLLARENGLVFTPLAFIWDVVFVVIGILWLVRQRKVSPHYRWLLGWLLIYPLGPSLINGDFVGFTTTRDIAGLPLLLLLSALGASTLVRGVWRQAPKRLKHGA